MGSGPKFDIQWLPPFVGLGFSVGRFPHDISIHLNLLLVSIYLGIGKGYDE